MTIEHFSYKDMNPGGPASLTEEIIDGNMEKHEQLEYSIMLENMETLEAWCAKQGKTEFFTFFQDSILGAYYRFVHAKRKTWDDKGSDKGSDKGTDEGSDNSGASECGKKRVRIGWPTILTGAAPIILAFMSELLGMESVHQGFVYAGMATYVVIALSGVVSRAHQESNEQQDQLAREEQERVKKEEEAQKKKRNYYETWSRHSLCLNRLCLALNKFAVSDRLAADFNELQKDTFEILEQNLDQFAMNLSSKGLAVRAKKDD